MRRLAAGLGLCQLGLALAAWGEGGNSVQVAVRLDQSAGMASPLVFGLSLPAPGSPGAEALLPELLRNRSFEKPALIGPRRMPEGWSKAQGWQLFAFGGNFLIARTELDRDEPLLLLDRRRWTDYHLSLYARKVDGPGGLRVLVEVQDEMNHVRWTLGAHGNRHHVIESVGRGRPRPLAPPVPGRIEPGRCYHIEMSVREGVLHCTLDGRLIHCVGGARFAHAGIGLGATDSTAEFFGITVHGPKQTPLFLLDDPSRRDLNTLAAEWALVRSPDATVRSIWDPLYPFNGHFAQGLRVEAGDTGEGGIAQGRIPVRAGTVYTGRVHLRGTGRARPAVSLRSASGQLLARQELGLITGAWSAHDFALQPSASDPEAAFAITIAGPASLWVDQASLANEGLRSPWGLRSDVVAGLRALRPTLLCWPAGPGANHYNWLRGIGPPGERPPMPLTTGSSPRFEPASADFGADEFLRLCEHLGAEPLVVLNPRLGTQGILDLLRYCGGGPDTPLGSQRAANGRREPYSVRFWLVGGQRTAELGAESYAVTLAELGREMRGFRPTPQLIAIGGHALAHCEDDVRDARRAGPLLTHAAKALAWQGGPEEGPSPRAGLAAAARKLREHSLGLAVLDAPLARDAASSAAAIALFLNALAAEGGPNALGALRCNPPQENNGADGSPDLFTGRAGRSPALATWALFREFPLSELLPATLEGAPSNPGPLDVAAGRSGNRIIIRMVSLTEEPLAVRVALQGIPDGRRLAQEAQLHTVSSGPTNASATRTTTTLPVAQAGLSLRLPPGQAAHLLAIQLLEEEGN